MKVYTEQSKKGWILARDEIHHSTYDGGLSNRKAVAKAQRKAARRQGKFFIRKELMEMSN